MGRTVPLTHEIAPGVAPEREPESTAASSRSLSVRELFDAHAAYVWRTLRHLGVPEADVEDVCQEVFVIVHRKLEGFEGRSSLKTWLYGICLRTASDYRRRAHIRREQPVSEPPGLHAEANQFDHVARQQLRSVLRQLLDELDEDKRAVFVLYEIEELTMKEIAGIVGCPLQTAYSRLHAAKKLMIEALQRREAVA